MPELGPPSRWSFRTISLAIALATLAVLPVFLLGAFSVLIRQELRFSETLLGAAVSFWYVTASIMSNPGGRIAGFLGPNRAMATAAIASGLGLAGIAALSHSWLGLLPFLFIGACGQAVAVPTANLALTLGAPSHQLGLAFGMKQSSVPLATVLAGIALPSIGLSVGWRWAFASGAAMTFVFAASFAYGKTRPPPARRRLRKEHNRGPLVYLGVAGGLGLMASNSLGVFYVESTVHQGYSSAFAGSAFAVAGFVTIVARLVWGWVADRQQKDPMFLIALLAGAGALGVTLLGTATTPPILIIATLLAFAAGWGWSGLLQYAIVYMSPEMPAEATGTVMTYVRIGNASGPLMIGFLAERASYRIAWLVAALLLTCSGALMLRIRSVYESHD